MSKVRAVDQVPQENEDRKIKCLPGCSGAQNFSWRSVTGFFLMGLLNNVIYVIMNASAKSISANAVGLVYTMNIVPSILVTLTLPYWFHLVSYNVRVTAVAILNALCLGLVGGGVGHEAIQLTGVALASFASSLGEASFLGYTALFPSKGRAEIAAWASGTGIAGVVGYAWNTFWLKGMETSMQISTLLGLVFPGLWMAVYFVYMLSPAEAHQKIRVAVEAVGSSKSTTDISDDQEDPSSKSTTDISDDQEDPKWNLKAKFVFICTKLWPYMIPLFLVYCFEYAMQAGAWVAIGSPIYSTEARADMYLYLNWMYQAGVFVSRSSGIFFSVSRYQLWLMPLLQGLFLVFFVLDSLHHFWIDYGLLAPAFATGLLGGFVYVHGYLLITKEIEPSRQEFSLTAACLANNLGITVSVIAGILIQGCLYAANDIVDCSAANESCTAPLFTCGHTFNTSFNATLL